MAFLLEITVQTRFQRLSTHGLAALVALGAAFGAASARADEVRVFAAGAAKQAVQSLAPAFEAATGHRIVAHYDTVGALRDRVLAGQPGATTDVVILSDAALTALRGAGQLLGPGSANNPPTSLPSSRPGNVALGKVVVALAVPASAGAPDIGTEAALRQALIAAPSIAYADPARGATAGTHFAKVVQALGLTEAINSKTTVLPFGVDVIAAVAEGRFALGVSQSSEIMQHHGIRFAGGLPAPHALATGYGAALASSSAAGAQWLAFVAGPQGTAAFAASGFVAGP